VGARARLLNSSCILPYIRAHETRISPFALSPRARSAASGGRSLRPRPNGPASGGCEEGFSLLEEGTKLLLRGLLSEMEPALRELQGALRELDAYHPPEVLPNGDILIRRKEPRPIPRRGRCPNRARDGEVDL
jgi:hypothetical protein